MSIPYYPDFVPLKIEHKNDFEKYYFARPIFISDHTFANYYIWKNIDKTQLTIIGDFLCPLVIGPDKNEYFMMPLGIGENSDEVLNICLSHSKAVIRADEQFISFLKEPENFVIKEDRDQFDYLYSSRDLIELKGRKYDAKRNHINYFVKNNDFKYEKMDKSHIYECLKLNEIWCKTKKTTITDEYPLIECEANAVEIALKNKDILGLKGGVIISNSKIVGFSLGEKLTSNTAVVHIEKSDPLIRGAAQIINREFLKNSFPDCEYVNREQDMGHLGLRKAKMSYHPAKLIRKYNIFKK